MQALQHIPYTPLATGFALAGGTTSKTLTVSGDATIDQSVAQASSPTFSYLRLGTATDASSVGQFSCGSVNGGRLYYNGLLYQYSSDGTDWYYTGVDNSGYVTFRSSGSRYYYYDTAGDDHFDIIVDYAGSGEIPAGMLFYGATDDLSLIAGSTAGEKLGGYYYNGTAFCSAWEVATVASGYSNLLLIRSGGNVGIGTTTFGAAAAKILTLGDGTAPGALADTASLVALAGELWAYDSAGNGTQQTSHPVDAPLECYSDDEPPGVALINKQVRPYDGVIVWRPWGGKRIIESFAHYNVRTGATLMVRDWDADESCNKKQADEAIDAWEKAPGLNPDGEPCKGPRPRTYQKRPRPTGIAKPDKGRE